MSAHDLSDNDALGLASCDDLAALMEAAASRRDRAHGAIVSYSPPAPIPMLALGTVASP